MEPLKRHKTSTCIKHLYSTSFHTLFNNLALFKEVAKQSSQALKKGDMFDLSKGEPPYLDDLEDGWGNRSIMSYERNRTTILSPQSHDINDIKSYR